MTQNFPDVRKTSRSTLERCLVPYWKALIPGQDGYRLELVLLRDTVESAASFLVRSRDLAFAEGGCTSL